jgi:threonine/homoserine/homoserine lactone efflux protein
VDVGLLITACFVASFSPGPAVLSTVETALRHGARRTLWHTLGLVAGEIPQSCLAFAASVWMTGSFPAGRAVVAVLGAAWFFRTGAALLLRPRSALPDAPEMEGAGFRLFLRGAWVNFSNPKTIPWLLAIIQASRLPTDVFAWGPALALVGAAMLSETTVMSLYAFLADRLRPRLRTPAVVRAVDRVTGVLWLGLAGLLGRQAWALVAGLLAG